MTYFTDMMAVLRLDASVWTRIAPSRKVLYYTMANVLSLGLIYGLSVLVFGRRLLEPGATFNPLLIMMVGVSVAFLVHGGAALYIWMFCRGIGGTAAFFPFYFHVGVAAIGFWFAAPAVALVQSGVRNGPVWLYLAISLVYGFAVLYPAVRQASRLSHVRLAGAFALTFVFVGCFLYLWVF
jgi:hypothetical protein